MTQAGDSGRTLTFFRFLMLYNFVIGVERLRVGVFFFFGNSPTNDDFLLTVFIYCLFLFFLLPII